MSDKPKHLTGLVKPEGFKMTPMPYVHDCEHGVSGGCEVTCQNCGHTCRRHMSGNGYCDHDIGYPDWCGCGEYQGTSG